MLRWIRLSLVALSSLALAACDDGGSGNQDGSGSGDATSDTGDTSTTTSMGDETGDGGETGDGDGDETGDGDGDGEPLEPVTITVFDEVTYYDGYAGIVDEPVPEGAIRHSNALYARPLSDAQLDSLQRTLKIGVVVGALCDNYDRLGHVYVSWVPKGATSYNPAEVQRVEIARFVTPFMDMNRNPKTVPFQWDADALLPLLKNEELRAQYDVWAELSIFGVPYAANTEVAGCEGRNDTQLGSLLLFSDSTEPTGAPGAELVPIAVNEGFNDYQDGASDAVGTTRKTRTVELPRDTSSAQLVLITSNHGANAGGEEYERRDHFVGWDGQRVHEYKPGRDTCEPFRPYNTQANGIYGPIPRTPEEWQAFSNWCPGDVIDTRIIELGAQTAGTHEFVIEVPDAVFVDDQGNFPFSLYLQYD